MIYKTTGIREQLVGKLVKEFLEEFERILNEEGEDAVREWYVSVLRGKNEILDNWIAEAGGQKIIKKRIRVG